MSLRPQWMLAPLALAASVVLAPRAARAQGDGKEPIRIEYRAEAGCPTAGEFNAQVFRRTSSARLATGGDTARTFIVGIERRGNTLTGSLVIRQADGTSESREVRGPDCSEVATVLALATALAIDPKASLAAEPTPELAATPEPPPPPLAPPQSKPGTLGEPSPPSADEEDGAPAPWLFTVGPAVEASVAPRVAFGGALGVAFRPSSPGAISAAGLELAYLATGTHHVGTASSTFDFIYARPSLCSVALRWQAESGIAPCLASELGAVTGSGTNVPYGSTRTRVWATVDVGLRLFQTLGARWFIDAEGSVVLPITRYRYVFLDPSTPVYSVPSAASAAWLRVGARFW